MKRKEEGISCFRDLMNECIERVKTLMNMSTDEMKVFSEAP